jgi:cysteinyl-tRNA synthetase
LNGFYDLFKRLAELGQGSMETDEEFGVQVSYTRVTFRKGMDDDLNTPVALAALQQFRNELNKLVKQGLSTEARGAVRDEFRSLGGVLGLFQIEHDKWQFNPISKKKASEEDVIGLKEKATLESILPNTEVQLKVDERNEARKQKDFKKADEIRQSLAAHGIVIEDKPDGTSRWKR